MNRLAFAFFASFAVILFVGGCGQSATDPAVLAEHRMALILSEEPDNARTVLEIRNAMYGVDASEEAAHVHHEADEHAGHDHAEGEHDAAEAAADEQGVDAAAHADHDHEHEHAEGEDAHAHADHGHADHDHAGHDHADHVHADEPKPLHSEMDVVMVGTVGGVPNPSAQSHPEFPFTRGKALFFVADPQAVAELEEHSHHHADGEECAFCAANAGDPAKLVAAVQFRDKGGKPLPIDARELFELKEKELVVVRGKATIGPGGMLVVDANGLFIRR